MNELLDDIKSHFSILETVVFAGQHTVCVRGADARALIERLRSEHDFDFLVDVTGLDNLKHPEDRPERFAVVYHIGNMLDGRRLRIRAYLPEENPAIRTVSDLYPNANWLEREVYDMFGFDFEGHPDLRRILMPDDYEGHPLRKDYPLKGRGERDNFPKYHEIPEE